MYWDKRGILKIYNFCRRRRRGLPHEARRLSKGVFSWLKRIPPLEPPETTRGHPSTPHCLSLQGITARAAQRTACGFLLLLSIWSASMSAQPLLRRGFGGAQRSAAPAAGLRRRFIPSLLGKPARLYKIRSPAAASRRSTAHTAHRLSYPRHTFSFCTAQHNAHNQVPYTAPTISHSAAEKICSPHSPCTFLRFSISVIVTITLRLWKVNLSFVKMFASC